MNSKDKFAAWALPILIALLTFVVFFPALRNGFVNWDDDANLVDNVRYRGLGWTQLSWMFTTFYAGHYQPLSWMTLGLDYLFWGMDPFGYHLTNLIIHSISGVLFYSIILRLLRRSIVDLPGRLVLQLAAGFGALLFAIHPLRVESVAWATERRDVLSGLFIMATVLCYLRAAGMGKGNAGRRRWLQGAMISYGLSLLSKASGMTLPVVLLILDVYPLRRLGGSAGKWFGPAARGVWLEKAPFVLMASAAAAIAALAQYRSESVRTLSEWGISQRLAQVFFGLTYYLWKTVVPVDLSPIYELPPRLDALGWRFVLSGAVVAAISVGLYLARRRWPAGLTVWVCYAAMLAPVLGIVQSGPQFVADRYSYLSCLGWAVLAGGALVLLWRDWAPRVRWARACLSLAVLMVPAALGDLTWKQTQVWHDSETFYKYVLGIRPDSRLAHNNLGYYVFASRGEWDAAIDHYRLALQIDPDYPWALLNLGDALSRKGKDEEAVEPYRRLIRLKPEFLPGYQRLAVILARQGKSAEAANLLAGPK